MSILEIKEILNEEYENVKELIKKSYDKRDPSKLSLNDKFQKNHFKLFGLSKFIYRD